MPASAGRGAPLWPYDALMLGVALLFGSSFPFAKLVVGALHPLLFTSGRWLLASLAAFALLAMLRRPLALPPREARAVLYVGVLFFTAFQSSWALALVHVPPGVAAILISTSPIFGALMARLRGRPMPALGWAGLLVALAGVALVINNAFDRWTLDMGSLSGSLWWLANAALWALYAAASEPVIARVGPGRTFAWGALFGSLALAPFAIALGSFRAFAAFDAELWFAFLYTSFGAGALAMLLWAVAQARLGPTRAILYMYLVPVAAVGLSVALRGESLTAPKIAGGLLALAGVALTRRAMAAAQRAGAKAPR
jgi:drug/metabolite transporter (DMT)-like permease